MQICNYRSKRTTRTIRRYLTILSVLAALMTIIVSSASTKQVGLASLEVVNGPSIWLDGPSQAIPGEELSYDITTDVTGLYGIQLELSFDPAVLQVVETQVTPGTCPEPDFVQTNSVDNSAGSISYVVTSINPTLPCDGGIVASFHFQVSPAATAGTTQVQFNNVILAESSGDEIPVTASDLDLEIVEPIAAFSAAPLLGPSPLAVDFTNLSSRYDSCTWVFGDGGASTNCSDPSHTYMTKGVYTVSLTVNKTGDGSDTEIKTAYITATDPVTAEFSGTPVSGVAPLTVNFSNESTGDVDTCLWEFGDGSTSSSCGNPIHEFTGPGKYTVSLTVDGLGGDSDKETKVEYIFTGEPVTVDFSGTPASGIASFLVDFTNLSSGDYDTCQWNFGDGGTSSDCNNPSHNYTIAGSYSVALSVSGAGGEDAVTKSNYITVYEPAAADFTGSPTSGPASLLVNFSNLSTGDISTCQWEFGDGDSSGVCTDPSHTYIATGVYTVSLTVNGNGGINTKTLTDYITVTLASNAKFTATPIKGIAPLTVAFTNSSEGGYDTCQWNFGDGGTSSDCNDPSHVYAATGVYSVSLGIDGTGGVHSATYMDLITIYDPVAAEFSGTPAVGPAPLTVNFSNLSTGDVGTCLWEFGDGDSYSSCGNPIHTYTRPGSYDVSLTVNGLGGDSDTETKDGTITVRGPAANFKGTPTSGIAPLTVNFTDLSTGDISTCLWEFGDGITDSSCGDHSHIYTSSGVYTVTLGITGAEGSDTETKIGYITVYDQVNAAFSGMPRQGIFPLEVAFTNLSSGDYDDCTWDFGDGVGSSLCANQSHVYTAAGVYTVELTVSGPGGSSSEIKVDYIVTMYRLYLPVIRSE